MTDDRTARAKACDEFFSNHIGEIGNAIAFDDGKALKRLFVSFATLETARLEAENKRLREGLEEAKDVVNRGVFLVNLADEFKVPIGKGWHDFKKMAQPVSAKIGNILNGDIEREGK